MPEFFNVLIRDARLKLGLHPKRVCGQVPVDLATYTFWEEGRHLPRVQVEQRMPRLARVLNLDLGELLESIEYSRACRGRRVGSRDQTYSAERRQIQLDPEDQHLFTKYTWYVNKDGNTLYAYTNARKPNGDMTTLKLHRVVLGARDGEIVDHINGDGLDNRKANLRIVTGAQNKANEGKKNMGRPTQSRYKGVHRYRRPARGNSRAVDKWTAQIRIDGKRKTLGYFDTEEEAAAAYARAAREHHGQYAYSQNAATLDLGGEVVVVDVEDADLLKLPWYIAREGDRRWVQANVKGKDDKYTTVNLHRLVAERVLGNLEGRQVRHAGDGLDNRRNSLKVGGRYLGSANGRIRLHST